MAGTDRGDTVYKIVIRAKTLGIAQGSQLTQFMDVDLAADHFKMRLEDWLAADNFNFAHDFIGIQNHVDRSEKTFDNRFLPRFSGQDS